MSGFISYARTDRPHLNRFLVHLDAIEKRAQWKFWHDQYLNPGDLFDKRIQDAIARSNLFILLMSPDFLKSTYIMDEELKAIRAKRDADPNGTLIIRTVLHPCDLDMVARHRQAVPSDPNGRLRPISTWDNLEHGFNQARIEIQKAMTGYTLFPVGTEDL